MQMKTWKKGLAILFTASMIISALPANVQAASKSKVKISKSKLTLYVGSAKTLKLKGTKKAPKWSSSKKSVATVSKKGKVKAKKKGSAVITAKLGKKKYKCKVTVKLKAASEKTPIVKPTEKPPVTPTEKPPVIPTEKPPVTPTKKPPVTPTEKPSVTPPTLTGGYQKLADYITAEGIYNPDDGYYFVTKEVENPSSALCAEIVYNVLDNNFEFFVLLTSDGGGTTLFSLTITPPEYAKGDVVNIFMSSTNDVYSASGKVVLSELTVENPSITYTSTDAPAELRDSLYELGEDMLSLGLQYWGLMLEEGKAAPSLRDLGFISCQD